MFRRIAIVVMVLAAPALAAPPSPAERREILDAARPAVMAEVGQAVKFKVSQFNVDANWAVVYGGLLNANGGPIDWQKAPHCNDDLDKSLWIVLAKTDARWRVAQLYVCSPEPPYWIISHYDWPCGVYAGLREGNRDLERECRRQEKDALAKP
jgi:hypothetical protein